jgi:MoaA/NifB/PqqE/SkfB family radical SAM enzyme
MKDFSNFGVKVRKFPEYNYHAVWTNLKTLRIGEGQAKELPADKSEFYDVSLGTRCNLGCDFCYTSALRNGLDYTDVCEKAKWFFGNMLDNDKPFQIAIGSQGEPTLHPDFLKFLETIYNLNIVPNYTTNGITIALESDYSEKLLDYTSKYVGGVAVSANTWAENINMLWRNAISKLIYYGNTNINIHYIIRDKKSVDEFINIYNEYKNDILYFVLLPLMKSGRSSEQYQKEAFDYLLDKDFDFSKIAFGAHFYDLLKNQNKVKCWMYPPESFSKNLILDDTIKITPSSFNLNPIIEYKWQK